MAGLSAALAGRRSAVFFPEGTSTLGASVRPFHPALFEAAVRSGRPVQPVALRYPARRGLMAVPFIGDDGFAASLCKVLREKTIAAELVFLPPQRPHGLSRRKLAAKA